MVCVKNPWASGRNVVSPYIAFTLYNVLIRWFSFVRVVIRLVYGVSHVEAILAYLLYSSFCSHTEIPLLISWEQKSMEGECQKTYNASLARPTPFIWLSKAFTLFILFCQNTSNINQLLPLWFWCCSPPLRTSSRQPFDSLNSHPKSLQWTVFV